MNKVYVLSPGENWIVDRFAKEWYEDNSDISVRSPADADVIWLLADWCWKHVPQKFLSSKKVITTVHHIVPEKFGKDELLDFMVRDDYTTVYHVYNQLTQNFIRRLTNKPIHLIPYWANQKIWNQTGSKEEFRKKYNIPLDKFVIGSFQRDTEGYDLKSPKLEKGPDLLADYIEKKVSDSQKPHVLLAGWRRQYIIDRIKKIGIEYSYLERPSQEVINELYQCLDVYPVTARCEGGPQSLIECGLTNTPVISRNVGIADQVLPPESINDNVSLATPHVPDVSGWLLPFGYTKYREMIRFL